MTMRVVGKRSVDYNECRQTYGRLMGGLVGLNGAVQAVVEDEQSGSSSMHFVLQASDSDLAIVQPKLFDHLSLILSIDESQL
jgi:hypothetical protein